MISSRKRNSPLQQEALAKDAAAIMYFAEKEGLTAHALSVKERVK